MAAAGSGAHRTAAEPSPADLVERNSSPQPPLHRPGGRTGGAERQSHRWRAQGTRGAGRFPVWGNRQNRNSDRIYPSAHRQYEIIWWIRAEHHDRVRDALVKLGQRLDLRQAVTVGGRDRTIAAVLEFLAAGLQSSWLLVYDNVAQPLDLQRYMPACRPDGHIIITSRLQNWPGYIEADKIRVSPFTERRPSASCAGGCPPWLRTTSLHADDDARRSQRGGTARRAPRPSAHRGRARGGLSRRNRAERR